MDVQKNTCFTVYSQKLAGKLMIKGFILVELGNDKMNPEKHVFYFKDTPLLRDAVNEYMIAHKR